MIGFPLGATLPDVKAYEARRAIFDGAKEVDMVINVGALKSGDDCLVEHDIRSVAQVAHEYDAICKVIIETALLTDDEKVRACLAAKKAGADFVKTSTGFSKGGATVADVALMRRTVGSELGVKASGGVKGLEDARKMVEAGATRIGASVGVKIAQEAAGKTPASAEYLRLLGSGQINECLQIRISWQSFSAEAPVIVSFRLRNNDRNQPCRSAANIASSISRFRTASTPTSCACSC